MKLYWDRQNREMVTGLYSHTALTQLDLVLRDTYDVELAMLQAADTPEESQIPFALGAGQTIQFMAKKSDALDGEALFDQKTWTKDGTGEDARYDGEISLNTAELIADMSAVDTLDVIGEFVVIDTDNDHVDSTQFTIHIIKDVNRGTEGTPTYQFPVIVQFTDPEDGIAKVRLVNSNGETCGILTPI